MIDYTVFSALYSPAPLFIAGLIILFHYVRLFEPVLLVWLIIQIVYFPFFANFDNSLFVKLSDLYLFEIDHVLVGYLFAAAVNMLNVKVIRHQTLTSRLGLHVGMSCLLIFISSMLCAIAFFINTRYGVGLVRDQLKDIYTLFYWAAMLLIMIGALPIGDRMLKHRQPDNFFKGFIASYFISYRG